MGTESYGEANWSKAAVHPKQRNPLHLYLEHVNCFNSLSIEFFGL
jgi:hypothetical protein